MQEINKNANKPTLHVDSRNFSYVKIWFYETWQNDN